MKRVLALDVAMNRTGWAFGLSAPDTRPTHGVFETQNWEGNEGKNLHRLRRWLDEKFKTATHIAMEQIFVDVRGADSKAFNFGGTEGQMMQAGVVAEWAESMGMPVFWINCDDWRRRFLGLNRKPKEHRSEKLYWKNLALKVAAQRGWFCEFHDEAEALGILDYTLAQLDLGYRDRTNVHLNKQHVDQIQGRGLHAR